MNVRLKNKKLHEILDKESHGNFTMALNKAYRDTKDFAVKGFTVNWFETFSTPSGWKRLNKSMDFLPSEVEVLKYNPNAWNDYPDVTPPEGVWMRFEYKNVLDDIKDIEPCLNEDELIGHRLIYRNGEWRDQRNWTFYAQNIREARFRPWDDDDE